MLYLFWWQTLIHVLVNIGRILFLKQNAHFRSAAKSYITENLFLLFLYFIFIVLFFGFFLSIGIPDLMQINFEVFFFMNWGFNLSLVIFFVSALFFRKPKFESILKNSSGFSFRNIILHTSIVLGTFIHFLVTLKFPHVFTEATLWSSVLVIFPFILLRSIIDYYEVE